MDKSTVWFFYMSLTYLAAGAILGLVMVFKPISIPGFLRVHTHVNLVGWVSMMIFGVSYHVIPRFSGRPMRYPRLIWPHFWLVNVGLVGMVLIWALGVGGGKAWGHLAGLFGIAISVGIGMFILNMVATIQVLTLPPQMVSPSQIQLPCQRSAQEAPETRRPAT